MDLILKSGRDLTSKYNISGSNNYDGLYDATDKYYAGIEFDVKVFKDIYFGVGVNVSDYGCISDTNVYYRDIPYYVLLKAKHNMGVSKNL
ncbi:MAG: hypothetical protein LBO62_06005 [Endomicrobium sp.]|nr:hypothetical protein [Endomicrobium sp.]